MFKQALLLSRNKQDACLSEHGSLAAYLILEIFTPRGRLSNFKVELLYYCKHDILLSLVCSLIFFLPLVTIRKLLLMRPEKSFLTAM